MKKTVRRSKNKKKIANKNEKNKEDHVRKKNKKIKKIMSVTVCGRLAAGLVISSQLLLPHLFLFLKNIHQIFFIIHQIFFYYSSQQK